MTGLPLRTMHRPGSHEFRIAAALLAAAALGPAPAWAEAAPTQSAAGLTFAAATLFAFAGGVLLNLMPCVFPVLSLKILGFVQQAHSDRAKIRAHGWAFAGGVLVSFWLLAGALVALRATGEQLGWGFQLQSPGFVAALAAIVTVLALSLCGVIELGTSMTTAGGVVRRGSGLTSSFWTGALATVVATPCTAPFMGSALGFAITQPPAVSMLVFTALGAGMAAPYLLLAYYPTALSRLPKPGPWMETFKQLMAFPLFATVVWLLHVFSLETEADAVWVLMLSLLALSFAVWLVGRAQHTGGVSMPRAAAAAFVATVAVGVGFSATTMQRAADEEPQAVAAEEFWQPWSRQKVAELREAGHGVFINFTAAWCLTCKVNEQVVFSRDDVRDYFRTSNVVALEADWTNEDEEIAEALAEYGRDGVPLYVFYPAEPEAEPVILPQILTLETFEETFGGASEAQLQRKSNVRASFSISSESSCKRNSLCCAGTGDAAVGLTAECTEAPRNREPDLTPRNSQSSLNISDGRVDISSNLPTQRWPSAKRDFQFS
jgi:thiol:disulfide interchange protein DsbD